MSQVSEKRCGILNKFTRLNPQGRVAPLGAFAWMSQKRIWIGRLRHTRQIENHHKKDQILGYPEGDYIFHFSTFYHLQLALIFRQKVSFLGTF